MGGRAPGVDELPAGSPGGLLPAGISAAAVQAEVAKILASPAFRRSGRLSRFLHYAVEEAIQGRPEQLKEYSIGVEVFDRGVSFDPRVESIVRVEAGKLRTRLKEYYGSQGGDDPLVVDFPLGSYVPVFRIRDKSVLKGRPSPGRRRRQMAAAAMGLVLMATAILVAWSLRRGPERFNGSSLTQLTFDLGLANTPAISADGNLVVYASDRGGAGNLNLWLQQTGGGAPIQLTHGEADNNHPDFSPDGSQIAFHSTRDGGGIYLVPVLGGEETLLAKGGTWPRFSPDGKWIAYSDAGTGNLSTGYISKMSIVSSSGGSPRQLEVGLHRARYPLWSPDGKHVLFWGTAVSMPEDRAGDWYVVPIDGGPPAKTGAFDWFREHKFDVFNAWSWVAGNRILFTATEGNSQNLWRARLSPQTWHFEGVPQRVTFGTGWEAVSSVAADGRMVFSSQAYYTNIWMLPLDANRGKLTGPLQRVTSYAAGVSQPTASMDGRKLVLLGQRNGNWEIRIKDFESGKETTLSASPSRKYSPRISGDGARVLYAADEDQQSVVYIADTSGGTPQRICRRCDALDVASDGRHALVRDGDTALESADLVDVPGGKRTTLIRRTGYRIHELRLSPDQQWAALSASPGPDIHHLFIVPIHYQPEVAAADWIPVGDTTAWDALPQWSPDGNLLYFASRRDGFLCVWAQPLTAATKRPNGPPFPVFHSHHARQSLNYAFDQLGISVIPGKMVFTMGEATGNIWMTRLEPMK